MIKLNKVYKYFNIILILFILFLIIQAFDQSFGWGMHKIYPKIYFTTFTTETSSGWNAFIWFENGLIEHELDHVFVGESDENPHLNPEEAMDFTWISIADLKKNMTEDPNSYTYWFKLIIETYGDSLKNYY